MSYHYSSIAVRCCTPNHVPAEQHDAPCGLDDQQVPTLAYESEAEPQLQTVYESLICNEFLEVRHILPITARSNNLVFLTITSYKFIGPENCWWAAHQPE